MDTSPSPSSPSAGALGWLSEGRRWLYAAGALVAIVVLGALALVPSGATMSVMRMQQLVDSAYSTSGTHCVAAAHGRDLCSLKAEKCHGTLLVAPTSSGHFAVVSSTPDQLESSACVKSEGGVGGFE